MVLINYDDCWETSRLADYATLISSCLYDKIDWIKCKRANILSLVYYYESLTVYCICQSVLYQRIIAAWLENPNVSICAFGHEYKRYITVLFELKVGPLKEIDHRRTKAIIDLFAIEAIANTLWSGIGYISCYVWKCLRKGRRKKKNDDKENKKI